MKWRRINVIIARLLVATMLFQVLLLPVTAFPAKAEKLYVDANLIQAYTPHVSEIYSINNGILNGCYKPKLDELDNIMEIVSKRYRYASVYGGYFDVDNTAPNNLGVTTRAIEVLGPDFLLDSEGYSFTDQSETSSIAGTYITTPVITEDNITNSNIINQVVSLDTAVMNIYKAMGVNLYDYKTKIEPGAINKETSPAIKGLPGTIRDVDGYKTYVFITRTNPVLYKEKFMRDLPSTLSSGDNNSLTISEFFILLQDMMEYYGEPIMMEQEMYELMQVYGADVPTYLDERGRRAYLYLKSRGIISDEVFEEDFFNPIKKKQMLDVLMRVSDENSRETYKNIQLTKSIDSDLISKGYYPKTITFADFDQAITADDRIIYEDAQYYDYLIKIDNETEFKNIVGIPVDSLYVADVENNGSIVVEDTSYSGRVGQYYHFSIPIKFPRDALLSNLIAIDSSEASDKPTMLLLPQGGGIYTFDSKSESTGMVRLQRQSFVDQGEEFENFVCKELISNGSSESESNDEEDENWEDEEETEDEENEEEEDEEEEDYSTGDEEIPDNWQDIESSLPSSDSWATLPDEGVFQDVLSANREELYGLTTYGMASYMIGTVNEMFYEQYNRDMSNEEWDKTFNLLEQWIKERGLGSDLSGWERNWGPLTPQGRNIGKTEDSSSGFWKAYAWIVDKISAPFCMTVYAATNTKEIKITNADNIRNRTDVIHWVEDNGGTATYDSSTKILTVKTSKFTKEEILSKCIVGLGEGAVGGVLGGTSGKTDMGNGSFFSTDAILSINGENALVSYDDLKAAGVFREAEGRKYPQEAADHTLKLYTATNGTVVLNNKEHLMQVGTIVYRVPDDCVLFKKVMNEKGQPELMIDFRAAYGWSANTVSFEVTGTGSNTVLNVKPRTAREKYNYKTFTVVARVDSSPQKYSVQLHADEGSAVHKLVLSSNYPLANWVLFIETDDKTSGGATGTLFVMYPTKLFSDNGISINETAEAKKLYKEKFGFPIALGDHQMRAISVTSSKSNTPGSISFDDDVGYTYVLPKEDAFSYKKYADGTYHLPMLERLSSSNKVQGLVNKNVNTFEGYKYGELPVGSSKTVVCEPAPVGFHVLSVYGMNTDTIAKSVSKITGGSQGSSSSSTFYAGTMAVSVNKGSGESYHLNYQNGGSNLATLQTKVTGDTKFYLASEESNYDAVYILLADGISLNMEEDGAESNEPPIVIGNPVNEDKFAWYKELTFSRLINSIDNFMSILLILTVYVMPLIFFSLGTLALGLAFIIRIKIVQLFCEKVFDPVKIITLFQSDYKDWGVGKSFKCLMVYYIMCFFLLKGNIILIIQFIWDFFRGIGQMFGFM